MKLVFGVFLLICQVLGPTRFILAAESKASWQVEWDRIVRAAEQEGQVTVSIGGYGAIIDAGTIAGSVLNSTAACARPVGDARSIIDTGTITRAIVDARTIADTAAWTVVDSRPIGDSRTAAAGPTANFRAAAD